MNKGSTYYITRMKDGHLFLSREKISDNLNNEIRELDKNLFPNLKCENSPLCITLISVELQNKISLNG